jgi:hypothetical protein
MELNSFVSIAEIVAAIGVIATLAYLAYQINQTNRIARSSAVNELQHKYMEFLSMVFADPALAELASRLKNPSYEPASDAEKQQLDLFANYLMIIWFSAHASYSNGQIEEQIYSHYLNDVTARLTQWPALKSFARVVAGRYPGAEDLDIFAPIFDSKKTRDEAT